MHNCAVIQRATIPVTTAPEFTGRRITAFDPPRPTVVLADDATGQVSLLHVEKIATTPPEIYRVEGEMYVLAGSRLTDALNSKARDFLAVTDAQVFDLSSNALLYKADYLAVNRDAIAIIIPVE